EHIRAVGPVRTHRKEARFAARGFCHERRELRLARSRYASQDDERLGAQCRHVRGNLPRFVVEPTGSNGLKQVRKGPCDVENAGVGLFRRCGSGRRGRTVFEWSFIVDGTKVAQELRSEERRVGKECRSWWTG